MVVPFQEDWTHERLEAAFTMQNSRNQDFPTWGFLSEPSLARQTFIATMSHLQTAYLDSARHAA